MKRLGAARDAGAFQAMVERDSRPDPNSITYGGVFNEHTFKCSKTDKVTEPFPHCGVDHNGNLVLGVEVVSVYDGKPRTPGTTLDLVIVIDISGSMSSVVQSKSKLQLAKEFAISVAGKLWKDDELAIITFENTANTILSPMKAGNMQAVTDAVNSLKTQGGTTVEAGLELGIKHAQDMRKNEKNKEGNVNHFSRMLLLTDMRASEVRSAEKKIIELTKKAAKDQIFTSYVGIGEDFDDRLTEVVTVSNASNYFSINSLEDFEKRVSNEMFSAFFPTVQDMELDIITKQHFVEGIFGAGKEIKYTKEGEGWTRENQNLYGEKTKELVKKFKDGGMNSDVIALIMNEVGEDKPITVVKEKSVFPSPSTSDPSLSVGGFVLITLKRFDEGKDSVVRIRTTYTNLDGTTGKVEKDVDLSEAEKAGKDYSSSEGMEKAMVLKAYVDFSKELCSKKYVQDSEKEFLEWFSKKAEKFELKKEVSNIEKIVQKLQEELKK